MNENIPALAEEILQAEKNRICADYGYLSYPLGKLAMNVGEYPYLVATDGRTLNFDGEKLLRYYADGGDGAVVILHPLLQCLFLHPFHKADRFPDWSVAADICTACVTDEMGLFFGSHRDKSERKSVYKSIIDEYDVMNASSCERYLQGKPQEEKDRLAALFSLCDHSLWQTKDREGKEESEVSDDGLEELWRKIALQTFSSPGVEEGTMKDLLSVSAGKRLSYRAFLRRILKQKEKKGLSQDEFDLNYYTYGLSLYGNLPLIESTETKEDRHAESLAIAIDTSGSTKGKPVRIFLEETRSVIEQAGGEEFGTGVRIIQCDDRIRSDVTVRTRREFDAMMESFELTGGGGTDFRPVFDLLEKESRSGKRIRGLIYFTDGLGVFPSRVPPFPSAFVLFGKDKDKIAVPKFAYRLTE